MSESTSPPPVRVQSVYLNPHVRLLQCSNDEVLIKHGGRSRFSHVLRDDGRTQLLGRLLRCLREPNSLDALLAQGVLTESDMESACNLVAYLLERQILIAPEDYLPHVYLKMQFGKTAAAITARSVGFIGSGPLGSRMARELARLGVRAIHLLDNRCLRAADRPYFDWDVSLLPPDLPYTQVVQKELAGLGHERVTTHDDPLDDRRALGELFEQSDVVVFALEQFAPRALHAANEVALDRRKPWLSLYADGSQALVGPLYVPGETPCYAEFEIQQEAAVALRGDYLIYKEGLMDGELDAQHFVLPPYLSMMSGWGMTALLPLLTTGRTFATGRCVWIDFERVSVDYQDVLKLPRCPACTQHRTGYPRHLFL